MSFIISYLLFGVRQFVYVRVCVYVSTFEMLLINSWSCCFAAPAYLPCWPNLTLFVALASPPLLFHLSGSSTVPSSICSTCTCTPSSRAGLALHVLTRPAQPLPGPDLLDQEGSDRPARKDLALMRHFTHLTLAHDTARPCPARPGPARPGQTG
jgi:hypothetical protein